MQSKPKKKSLAEQQNAARKNLKPQDQLKELDARLGEGVGATKERKRLQALISKQ